MNKSSRDVYWDAVKGVGIMLVLLGHLLRYGSYPSRVIFNFHMPLFFFVSGVFFHPDKIASVRNLMEKIGTNLIIPWVFFSALSFIPYVLLKGTILPSVGVGLFCGISSVEQGVRYVQYG